MLPSEAVATRIKNAFATLEDAWSEVGDSPTRSALYSVLAVAGLESGYGVGFGANVNNWGAIQCSHGPPCGADCLPWGDNHSDGSGYTWCYRRYATPRAGAADLARLLVRKVGVQTLNAGDAQTLARKMYEAKYYEGIGPTPEARIAKYAGKLETHFKDIRAVLGNEGPTSGNGPGGWPIILIAAGALLALVARR